MFDKRPGGHYFNTTPVQGKVLKANENAVKAQNDKIYRLFESHPHADFTPYEVYLRFGQQIPEGSIKRGMSQLDKEGWIIRSGNRRPGPYGHRHMQNALKLNKEKPRP